MTESFALALDTQSLVSAIVTVGTLLTAIRYSTVRLEKSQIRIWRAIEEQQQRTADHDRRITKIELTREILAEVDALHTARRKTRSQ